MKETNRYYVVTIKHWKITLSAILLAIILLFVHPILSILVAVITGCVIAEKEGKKDEIQ